MKPFWERWEDLPTLQYICRYCEMLNTKKRIAEFTTVQIWVCTVSVCTSAIRKQPDLKEGVPTYDREVQLDDLWSSLPTQTILWFYDFVTCMILAKMGDLESYQTWICATSIMHGSWQGLFIHILSTTNIEIISSCKKSSLTFSCTTCSQLIWQLPCLNHHHLLKNLNRSVELIKDEGKLLRSTLIYLALGS